MIKPKNFSVWVSILLLIFISLYVVKESVLEVLWLFLNSFTSDFSYETNDSPGTFESSPDIGDTNEGTERSTLTSDTTPLERVLPTVRDEQSYNHP